MERQKGFEVFLNSILVKYTHCMHVRWMFTASVYNFFESMVFQVKKEEVRVKARTRKIWNRVIAKDDVHTGASTTDVEDRPVTEVKTGEKKEVWRNIDVYCLWMIHIANTL